jgi:hypothetical protein
MSPQTARYAQENCFPTVNRADAAATNALASAHVDPQGEYVCERLDELL